MTRMSRIGVAAVLLFAGSSHLAAQATRGSTTTRGHVDSVFVLLLRHLAANQITPLSVDSSRHILRFVVPATGDEAVEIALQQRGDSTRIEAGGVRGGIRALLMGLGEVRRALAARDAVRSAP